MAVYIVNVFLHITGIDVLKLPLADASCAIPVIAINEHESRQLVTIEGIELVPAPALVAIEELLFRILVKIAIARVRGVVTTITLIEEVWEEHFFNVLITKIEGQWRKIFCYLVTLLLNKRLEVIG